MKTHFRHRTKRWLSFALCTLSLFFFGSCLGSGEKGQWVSYSLNETEFKAPEREYYPETWYHYIGGNVSKPGITADLEAIAQAGISGIQLFHGQFGGEWPAFRPRFNP